MPDKVPAIDTTPAATIEPLESMQATISGPAEAGTETLAVDLAGFGQRLKVGALLGEYRLERHLGAGGMGEVFLARRRGAAEAVALKVLPEVHGTRLYRFKREFRALADVRHENLIALDELVVLADGRAFFTMEYVEGVPFVEYVRGDTPPGQLPNIVRLERALRQLVDGVHHLHLARCVHRDLKPSNVLVTREGRVVILDFGLISELSEADEGLTRDGQMMGTPAYMAPEQAGGEVAGPAADYYAIGGMLFECLTGKLPYVGTVLDILIEKRHGKVPDPRARLAPGSSVGERAQAMCELCQWAMAPEPDQRPGGKDFLEQLRDIDMRTAAASMSAPGEVREVFVGRQKQLAALEAAFDQVRDGMTPVAVHLRGASGQGKSALVGHFLHSLRRRDEVVILRGRCLERESVPYKGIDAVVDALSVYLRRLDEVDAAGLQPRHLAPLLQLFPVLGTAWPRGGRAMDLDPAELRRRGLAGLREVLDRVGARNPLVVYVDDFQWADVDSARLLTELMRPPDPPAMLLLITYRDEVDAREVLQLLTGEDATAGRDVRELEIGPLSEAEARELALALLADRSQADAAAVATSAELFARRAQGNPFYIGQMVLGDDTHSSTDASLDRLVARRIVALEPRQRRVLATVAVAGGPTPVPVVLAACVGDESQADTDSGGADEIEALLAANLLRRHDDGRLESAHDRIREVAVGELSPAELRATHLAVGRAFEAIGGGEAQAQAEHFAIGGDEGKALDYTEQAAAEAAKALAFERAAQLYRRALGLLGDQPGRRRTLEQALGEQLVDLGRGAEAAAIFQQLAGSAQDPREARDLRRRAASELVKAGYLDEGMDAITPVLREVGIWQPLGPALAILGTVWNRILLAIRGYGFVPRDAAEVSPRLLERIDTLLATKTGLSHHEAIFAGYQQARAIRLALPAGEPRRLIRCLVHEASILVAMGRYQRGRELMDRARELVVDVREPEYHRVIEYVTANHLDHSGRWREAAAGFAELHRHLDESPNSGWIRGASTVQWNYVRKLLGELARLRSDLPELVASARDLGVRHELVSLGSLRAFTMAVYGEVEAARRLLAEIREQWHPRQITFQHIIIAMIEVEIELLDGRSQAAVAAAERVLGDTKARIVSGMMPSHVDFYELRARSRVHAALEGVDVQRSLTLARRDLGKLRRSHKPQVGVQALLIEAALYCCEDDQAAAEATWRTAAERFEAMGMAAHLAAARWRLGQRGDAAAQAAAQAYFDAQGLAEPLRLIDALAPGR